MDLQFHIKQERAGTSCVKWDFQKEIFGCGGLLPFWIADTDFTTVPEVVEALQKRAAHGILGYTDPEPGYFSAVRKWFRDRHGWEFEEQCIVPVSGVVPALNAAIQTFTSPEDRVLLQPPVYDPFFHVVQQNNRIVAENPLMHEGGRFVMDYQRLKREFDGGVKMMILCSPHNPVGRVWTQEELRRLAILCKTYNVLLVSDEIHCDIVFRGHQHTPMAQYPEIADHLIVCTSPAKTFNLAGLQTANAIIPNEGLRARFRAHFERAYEFCPNLFGLLACETAYQCGERWLDEQIRYLEKNRDLFLRVLGERAPQLAPARLEGTFLMWVDCTSLGRKSADLTRLLAEKHGIAVGNGAAYGSSGEGWLRWNIGCHRSVLQEGLDRFCRMVDDLI